jgi:hypothetical protein
MQIADVRKRLHDTMARAKQRAADRRGRTEATSRAFDAFLNGTAIPLVRQVANVLRADSYFFTVSTPSGSVRLASDKSGQDFIEISLDTSVDAPRVVARVSYSRGKRSVDAERVVASGDPAQITEEELLVFLLEALEPFVER